MNAGGRLSLYAAAVLVAFAGAFGVSAALSPDEVASARGEAASGASADQAGAEGETMQDHTAMAGTEHNAAQPGLALAAGGYVLSPVTAPGRVGEPGELSFRILADDGEPLTAFTRAHEKDLHLIVVRSDGAHFRHVHPTLDVATGTWSLPWEWDAAGTYRVYADFTPKDGGGLTLTRTVQVAGEFAPVDAQPVRTSTVHGFTAVIEGDLVAGASGELTIEISRDGEPVTTLEPYLGAFGHLVALRDGDLAYLHVHPQGEEPEPGETSGPTIAFAAHAPTAGRYLLYLDFQVDGEVHTAQFVLDAAGHGDHDTAAPAPQNPAEQPPAPQNPAETPGHDDEPHGH